MSFTPQSRHLGLRSSLTHYGKYYLLRWLCVLAVVATGLLAAACSQSAGANFPTREITLIIPWTAGTYADAVGRPVAEMVGSDLKQPVVVNNVAGASGTLGLAQAAEAAADGYTLVQVNPASLTILPQIQQVPYTLDTFEPIAQYGSEAGTLLVQADSDIKNIQDFIEKAKKEPNSISYSTPGVGTVPHLLVEQFGNMVGAKFKHVPFKSSGEGVNALIGGHVTSSVTYGTDVNIHVKEGRLKALVVFAEQRLPALKDVPTTVELGYKVVGGSWQGVAVKAGTPPEVVKRLQDSFYKVIRSQELASIYQKMNAELVFLDADAFRAKWQSEKEMYSKAIEQAGIQKTK